MLGFVAWIDDDEDLGTVGQDLQRRKADLRIPKFNPQIPPPVWKPPMQYLSGPPITDPIMISANKAILVAWGNKSFASPLSAYGTDPQDLTPMWTQRDGIMLHAFSTWWNGSGYQPGLSIGTGAIAQVPLDQEHANALATWAGSQAGGTQIPQSFPIPIPSGGLPIPAPPGWPASVPRPVPPPPFWPAGLSWPPLATSAAPSGWPSQWPWPPSATNPPPGLPWPPPGWPSGIPLPIPIPPGWVQPTTPTPPPTPPPAPTQPTLPPPPAPIQPTTTTKKKSNTALWIGGGIAAAIVAVVVASK